MVFRWLGFSAVLLLATVPAHGDGKARSNGITVYPALVVPGGTPYAASPAEGLEARVIVPQSQLALHQTPATFESPRRNHPEVTDRPHVLKTPGAPPDVREFLAEYPDPLKDIGEMKVPAVPTPAVARQQPGTLSEESPLCRNLLYTEEDRALFAFRHPLMTPDIQVRIIPAEPARPTYPKNEAPRATNPG